jgi:hypothetical protein
MQETSRRNTFMDKHYGVECQTMLPLNAAALSQDGRNAERVREAVPT